MSQQTYCDICGNVDKSQMIWIQDWNKDESNHIDVCKNCYDKIKKIIGS